jgi:hypothetical protein
MTVQELTSKEILTAEEAKLVSESDPTWAGEYLFHNFWNNTYLNLSVYSEVDHDRRQFEMERGY